MARELTSTQHTNVEAGATRPIYLVEWNHSGTTEYLSCSGTVQYGSGSPVQTYTAGGLTITGIEDSKTATIVLPATAARITEILGNTWRGGVCKITAILAAPGDTPLYSSAQGLLMLDGVIETSTFSGETITVVAKCKYYTGALVPRFTFNDVTGIIPAVGSVSTWEGENYSYEQWLKTTAAIQRIVRPGVNPQVTGRPSTTQVNSLAPVEQTGYKLLTAEGVNIPIVYGRASVPGYIFADGEYSGDKFIGVAWCMGEVFSIEKVFINDAEIPSTVKAKHYRGTTYQTVSPALQLYTNTSPQFSDNMILNTPAGDIGICYSVFNIPASAISGAPRFRAIINGRLVEDPTSAATSPFDDYVGFSFDFLTGLTDSSPNAHTLTLAGGANIASPSIGLQLDGTGDYATIADSATLELGSLPFTLEIEAATNTLPASPGTPETLICHGATTSPLSRSIRVDMLGDELLLYMSSDGSTWDIANGLSCGTVVGSPSSIFRLVVERVDNQISTYINGTTQLGIVSTLAVFDGGDDWEIGACGGAQEWSGVIRSARLTVGAYRYGSPHAITNTPFSDSGTYTSGKIYSEKPALAWNDLAKDPVIGLSAATTGLGAAIEYGDSAMSTGAPRCRLGIAISEPRLVESWLDQLAMYANCLWFPQGDRLKIIPDKIKDGTNGSGKELYNPVSPEVFGSPLPSVTTEDGVSYSVSIQITIAATTSPITGISVNLGGVEVIPVATAIGTHGGTITVSGTSNTVEVIEEAGFNGEWANLSVKRTHRLIDQWLPSTLSVTGLAEGDKPNAVLAKYTIPDDTTGAWKQDTFGVMNEAAAAGVPIVLTTIELPGVTRIQEASNKAIAKLQREDKKVRISLISTDEEVVCQPGDTVQVLSTYRGIDAPVWVESSRMTSYGRFQITGTIYRDRQYPDEDYTDGGKLYLEGYTPVVTVDPELPIEEECQPYSCSALASGQEQGLVVAGAVGSGMWDLLDYQDNTGQIPQYFRTVGAGSGWDLTCTNSLSSWTAGNIKSSLLVPANGDIDACNPETNPRCCSNVNSAPNSVWWVANMTAWGSKLPNVNMSVVSRGMGSAAGNQKSRLFLGYGKFGYYTQTAYTSNGYFEVNCWGGRSSDNLNDVLIFNSGKGAWQKTFTLPLGLLTSSEPVLVQIELAFSDVDYPASSYQGYYYASYDMKTTMTASYRITKKDGTVADGTYSYYGKINQVFDFTHGNGTTRPINEAYKAKSLPTTFTNNYLLGTFSGLYNLSIAHEVDGATGVNMGGGNPGGINNSLSVSFTRNYSTYTVPAWCSAP